MKKAFTMIELILAVVIIGILSYMVMPNFFDLRFKADLSSLKAEYSAINANIRAKFLDNLMQGKDTEPYTDLGNNGKDLIFTYIFKDGLKLGKFEKGWAYLKYGEVNPSSGKPTFSKDGLTKIPGTYDFYTDYKSYIDSAKFADNEKVVLYRFSASENVYYKFMYRSKLAKFICTEAVCNGCSKAKKDYINSIVSCEKKAS